jgi:hypothetical protein
MSQDNIVNTNTAICHHTKANTVIKLSMALVNMGVTSRVNNPAGVDKALYTQLVSLYEDLSSGKLEVKAATEELVKILESLDPPPTKLTEPEMQELMQYLAPFVGCAVSNSGGGN